MPERVPAVGELVLVRSRRWLVEEVESASKPGLSPVVSLACADDDAQGQTLQVYWDYEPDRMIVEDEGWDDLAARGFDTPRRFAAFLHTLRWSSVTATDPSLFSHRSGQVSRSTPTRWSRCAGPAAAAREPLHHLRQPDGGRA